jgi:hypothetical protein
MLVHCYRLVNPLLAAALATILLLWSVPDGLAAQSTPGPLLPGDGDVVELSAARSACDEPVGADTLPGLSDCCSSWHCSAPQLAVTASNKLPPPSRLVLWPPLASTVSFTRDAVLILEPPR